MDSLLQLQTWIKTRLLADTYFEDVPVYLEDHNDLSEQLDIDLGTTGIAVVIGETDLVAGPDELHLLAQVEISVGEQVTQNRSAAGAVAINIFNLIHGWSPDSQWDRPQSLTLASANTPERAVKVLTARFPHQLA